jgi:uncharacterized protein
MSKPTTSLFRIYGFAVTSSLLILALVGFKATFADFVKVLILAGLEITFSFDNAVVNAKILARMSPFWQKLFMTVGILIAVFGVRVIVPILLVAATARMGIGEVLSAATQEPEVYAKYLGAAHPLIAAFGGIFLLMIFLDFILEDRKIKWLVGLERLLARAGKLENVSVLTSLSVLLGTTLVLVPHHEQIQVLVAGIVGLLTYLVINALDSMAAVEDVAGGKNLLKSGFVGFMYLELIDASFSLDGVVGAFAITDKIILIAAGLGIGALFVRSLTVHMLRRGTLAKYRYMEHGAHYAIGILAVLLLASIHYQIPEAVSGLSGVAFILVAIAHSHIDRNKQIV